MDSDRRSAQVEWLEVVDTGRRRRWSEDEKLKIVLESLQAPGQVAATARRYGISRSLLVRIRRKAAGWLVGRPALKQSRTFFVHSDEFDQVFDAKVSERLNAVF